MNVHDRIKENLGSKIADWQEKSPRRVYFSIKKEDVVPVAEFFFKQLQCRFSTASCTQGPHNFELLYHFSHDKTGVMYSFRVLLDDMQNLEVDSIAGLFVGAEWIEREIWELLGVNFKGHPNLKRLLLSEDWPEGNYPLRRL